MLKYRGGVVKVLILDDDQARVDLYKKNNPDVGTWVHYMCPFKAAEDLSKNTYDLICLDHDLGEIDKKPVDAMPLVAKLREHGLPAKTTVFVHSMNVVGSRNIHSDLSALDNKVLLVPGAWTRKGLIKLLCDTEQT